MKHLRSIILVLLIGIGVSFALPAQAQSACAHVKFQIDSDQTVDQQAVCESAQPWAEKGIQLFIYLTDSETASEEAWFALLDEVEVEAGIRDPSQVDAFSRNTLALEASTAEQATWAYTVTYGDLLFDTPLDRSPAALNQLKNEMRLAIADGETTAGFTKAVNLSYQTNYPPPSPFVITFATLVGLALAGTGGYFLYVRVVGPAWEREQKRRRLKNQLALLQKNVANLLLACERLLSGQQVDDAVLYQLFEGYGGAHYPERQEQVREWIRRSREALNDAFDLRRSLQMEDVQAQQSLAQQVENWEMIYITLVGTTPRIQDLTEEELRDLLDPVVILEREDADVKLTEQLDEIRRQIAGMAFKVQLMQATSQETDQLGILGYIDQIESQLAELVSAKAAAPTALDEAQRARLRAEEEADSATPFGMTASQILKGIDSRLAEAKAELSEGIFLDTIESAELALIQIEIVEDLLSAVIDHDQRTAAIQAVTDQGYAPDTLPDSQQAVQVDIERIVEAISGGEYLKADDWIDELDAHSQGALDTTEAWQALHQSNQAAIEQLAEKRAVAGSYFQEAVLPAQQGLANYPAETWEDVTRGVEVVPLLDAVETVALPQIIQDNSMATQALRQAEARLVAETGTVNQLQRSLEAIVQRLEEIQAAEAHIDEGLRLTDKAISEATRLRDAEDSKISPVVDQMIDDANRKLAEAKKAAAARRFIDASNAQAASRKLAQEAFVSAQEQVERINKLQTELSRVSDQLEAQVTATNRAGETLSPLEQTSEGHELLRQMNEAMTAARQKLIASRSLQDLKLVRALTAAINAFDAAGQAAEAAEQRVQEDRRSYANLQAQSDAEIALAQAAVATAAARVNHRDAASLGQLALQRAQQSIPYAISAQNPTRAALNELIAKAKAAQQAALEAQRKADQAISSRQAARRAAAASVARTSSGSSYRSSSRSSNRSQSRSSSSSSRSSNSSSSRRSSSSGSSRRSSSMGSSRRR